MRKKLKLRKNLNNDDSCDNNCGWMIMMIKNKKDKEEHNHVNSPGTPSITSCPILYTWISTISGCHLYGKVIYKRKTHVHVNLIQIDLGQYLTYGGCGPSGIHGPSCKISTLNLCCYLSHQNIFINSRNISQKHILLHKYIYL